jgi:peptide-methionine (S)-S-oxide reductase
MKIRCTTLLDSSTQRVIRPGPRPGKLPLLVLSVAAALAACTELAATPPAAAPHGAVAIFAGGCFWCVEQDFEKLPGVIEVESGYTGGHTANPSYEQVSSGTTGHAEAVRVIYDPQQVSYARLVEYFWRRIDPTVKDRQFCDVGAEYRSAIYWQNDEERRTAEASRDALLKSGALPAIYTELARAGAFWIAEDYHQDYYRKNPIRYQYYRHACGRDARIERIWGPNAAATLDTTPASGATVKEM